MKQVASIDWSQPGSNRYTSPVHKAINTYTDIPADIRAKLIAKSESKQYDDIVEIDLNGIHGRKNSYTNLRQMFFGVNVRAEVVTRKAWPAHQIERGFVYIEGGYAILVPFICTNVSRVDVIPLAPRPSVVQEPVVSKGPFLVPEPSSLALSVLGVGLCFVLSRRNKLKHG